MTLLATALLSAALTAPDLLRECRSQIPQNAELTGEIVMRSKRGIVLSRHDYRLVRTGGETSLFLDGQVLDLKANPVEPLAGTDVTPSDLALDYLSWPDVSFDEAREGETVNGCAASILVLRQGERKVLIWIDRKTHALLQAEEWRGEKPFRRLWGTRLKKFGERWMANVMEVETLGSGHRTKITVEELK